MMPHNFQSPSSGRCSSGPARVIQGSFPAGRPSKLQASVAPASVSGPPWTAPMHHNNSSPSRPGSSQPAAVHLRQGLAPPLPASRSQPAVLPRPTPAQCSGGKAFQVPAGFALRPPGMGQRLPEAVQRKMESIFGTDFSGVRVHVGAEASSIGALAFTAGSDLYFAPGQYNPASAGGQALIGHELTHVVQQRAGRVRNPLGSGMAVVQDPRLEAEAEQMGRVASSSATIQSRSSIPTASLTTPGAHGRLAAQARADARLRCAFRSSSSDGDGIKRIEVSDRSSLQALGSVNLQSTSSGSLLISDLHVPRGLRRRGLGTLLMREALTTGRRQGATAARLEVRPSDSSISRHALCQMYMKLGFRKVGVSPRGNPLLEYPLRAPRQGTAAPATSPLLPRLAPSAVTGHSFVSSPPIHASAGLAPLPAPQAQPASGSWAFVPGPATSMVHSPFRRSVQRMERANYTIGGANNTNAVTNAATNAVTNTPALYPDTIEADDYEIEDEYAFSYKPKDEVDSDLLRIIVGGKKGKENETDFTKIDFTKADSSIADGTFMRLMSTFDNCKELCDKYEIHLVASSMREKFKKKQHSNASHWTGETYRFYYVAHGSGDVTFNFMDPKKLATNLLETLRGRGLLKECRIYIRLVGCYSALVLAKTAQELSIDSDVKNCKVKIILKGTKGPYYGLKGRTAMLTQDANPEVKNLLKTSDLAIKCAFNAFTKGYDELKNGIKLRIKELAKKDKNILVFLTQHLVKQVNSNNIIKVLTDLNAVDFYRFCTSAAKCVEPSLDETFCQLLLDARNNFVKLQLAFWNDLKKSREDLVTSILNLDAKYIVGKGTHERHTVEHAYKGL
jgi:GNAT superfamily N-acetyltransferase